MPNRDEIDRAAMNDPRNQDEVERREDVSELLDEANPPQPTGGVERMFRQAGLYREDSAATDVLIGRIDQLLGWAKSGKTRNYYLMDIENVDQLPDNLMTLLAAERTKARVEELERLLRIAHDEYESDPKKILTLGYYFTEAVAKRLAELREGKL